MPPRKKAAQANAGSQAVRKPFTRTSPPRTRLATARIRAQATEKRQEKKPEPSKASAKKKRKKSPARRPREKVSEDAREDILLTFFFPCPHHACNDGSIVNYYLESALGQQRHPAISPTPELAHKTRTKEALAQTRVETCYARPRA